MRQRPGGVVTAQLRGDIEYRSLLAAVEPVPRRDEHTGEIGDDAIPCLVIAVRSLGVQLLRDIGFDARDAGPLDWSRELEGMARLWIAQAFGHGLAPTSGWALVDSND